MNYKKSFVFCKKIAIGLFVISLFLFMIFLAQWIRAESLQKDNKSIKNEISLAQAQIAQLEQQALYLSEAENPQKQKAKSSGELLGDVYNNIITQTKEFAKDFDSRTGGSGQVSEM